MNGCQHYHHIAYSMEGLLKEESSTLLEASDSWEFLIPWQDPGISVSRPIIQVPTYTQLRQRNCLLSIPDYHQRRYYWMQKDFCKGQGWQSEQGLYPRSRAIHWSASEGCPKWVRVQKLHPLLQNCCHRQIKYDVRLRKYPGSLWFVVNFGIWIKLASNLQTCRIDTHWEEMYGGAWFVK